MDKHVEHGADGGHYGRLLLMAALSFVAMYLLMYAMVDRIGNVLPNHNQFYMAGLMTMPMVAIELVLMGRMYPRKRLNALIVVASVALLGVFWVFIRQQVAITDAQFLRSMIPHHGGAILMCEQSPSRDPDILRLCEQIVASQRSEIALMKTLLETEAAGQ